MIKQRALGSTGARVSELCLGAMTFGEPDESSFMHRVAASEATAQEMMDRCLEAGVNFWDTADVYGQDGLSERIVGRWFKARGRRHEVVLATKCRFPMGPGPNQRGASRLHITRAVDASLRRLQTDHIDLFQIHMQDLHTPEEEVLRALDDLVRAGKLLYIGCSNYAAYRLMESLWISDRRSLVSFATLQAKYNLLDRNLEREHLPALAKFGLGLLPWSPLAGGLLSGKYRAHQDPPTGARFDVWRDRYQRFEAQGQWPIVEALIECAAELEASPAQLALAWLLTRPTVSSVIFGARTIAQLEDNLAAASLEIPETILEQLNSVSAPPLVYPYDFIQMIDGAW